MNLVEAMVASAMFVTSSSCSLQLWSGSVSWARQAEVQQQQAAQLEAALLSSQAQLTALAGTAIAADCTAASSWLAAHLQSLPSGEGPVRQVSAEPGGLVRLQVTGAGGEQRQRWYSPAAFGLCGAPSQEQGDATT